MIKIILKDIMEYAGMLTDKEAVKMRKEIKRIKKLSFNNLIFS